MTKQRLTSTSRVPCAVAVLSAMVGLGLASGCPYQPTAGQPCPYSGSNCFDEDRSFNFDDARVDAMDLAALPAAPVQCRDPVRGRVIRVVDGDTFDVLVDGVDGEKECGQERMCERIRLIGVDTPETFVRDGLPQCGGDEAKLFTQTTLGHRVALTFDQDCLDGPPNPEDPPRNLAYAWFGASRPDLWQTQLGRRGFSSQLTVAPNDTFEAQFAEDERAAQSPPRGIWTECREVPTNP